MFFIKLGRIFAWVILVLGVMRVLMGFAVANIDDAQQRALATARYLGSGTTGHAIDKGSLYILLAIALGILAEIGIAINRKSS